MSVLADRSFVFIHAIEGHHRVMDGGVLQHPDTGVVQGGVISPVLANVVLHHVLDA